MYIIEAHDRGRAHGHDIKTGTRELLVGSKGNLQRPGQALGALLAITSKGSWNRAYVIQDARRVVCVWARKDEQLFCVAHTKDFRVRDSPPYLYEGRTEVITGTGGNSFPSMSAREKWALEQFGEGSVATAVLIHVGRICYAWEQDATGELGFAAEMRRPIDLFRRTSMR